MNYFAGRDLPVHALDVEVDLVLPVLVGLRVLRQALLAGVVDDRAGEDLEAPRLHRFLDAGDLLLRLLGHPVRDLHQVVLAFLHAPDGALGLPGAVHRLLDRLLVVVAPVDDGRAEMRLGRDRAHVAVPAERELAVLLRRLQHRGRVGVLQQHVGAAVDQRLRRLALLRRVEPAVDPHHSRLDLRVDAQRAERVGVDVPEHLRDRERRDEPERAGLRHRAGDHSGEVRVLVELGVVDPHVRRGLVAGRMLELDIGELGRDLEHRLHEAERRRKDELVPLRGEIADHALGVRPFGHLLDERGLHLGAELGLDRLARLVVGEGPAGVADRPDVYPGDLERLGGRRGGLGIRRRRCGLGRRRLFLAAGRERGHRGERRYLQPGTLAGIEHGYSSWVSRKDGTVCRARPAC